MPRWPAGWHPDAGSGIARGGQPVRPPGPPQRHYWRRTTVELKAATNSVILDAAGTGAASIGPAGVGEIWQVTLVQVQVQPALLTQPCQAQVWRGVGGFTQNLLSLTGNGGYDDLGVTGQPLRAGEQIIVIWIGVAAIAGMVAWATIEGTKEVLEAGYS